MTLADYRERTRSAHTACLLKLCFFKRSKVRSPDRPILMARGGKIAAWPPPIGASRQSVQLLRAGGWEQPKIRCLEGVTANQLPI